MATSNIIANNKLSRISLLFLFVFTVVNYLCDRFVYLAIYVPRYWNPSTVVIHFFLWLGKLLYNGTVFMQASLPIKKHSSLYGWRCQSVLGTKCCVRAETIDPCPCPYNLHLLERNWSQLASTGIRTQAKWTPQWFVSTFPHAHVCLTRNKKVYISPQKSLAMQSHS